MANGLFNLKQVVQAIQQGGWPAQKTPAVEYLVVAGGGGGGYVAGGAGAGGLLQGIDPVPNGQTLLVTVGGGGAGGTGGAVGASGTNSVFGAISATGGGAGGSYAATAGASGGSGGGAQTSSGSVLSGTVGQGTVGQGNAGGLSWSGSQFQGGGGGGAGTVGLNAVSADSTFSGNGGAGVASAISGTVTTYAGGGGGASDSGSVAGNGGVGGGGAGGASRGSTGGTGTVNGGNGTANTGGGAGSYGVGGTGGTGGTGIVIVSYPDVYAAPTSTTGSPTVSTSGSGSVFLNGSAGTYFTYGSQAPFAFGTGDFTIEFWMYTANVISQNIFFDGRASGTNGAYPTIYFVNGNIYYLTAGINAITGTITTNTWYHIAVARSGTVTKMFVNGTQAGSPYTDTTNYLISGPTIGCSSLATGVSPYTGYFSNFRIVKGTAVYTSNFTPSTTPLTAITNTSLLLNTVSGSYLADCSTNSYTPTSVTLTPTWNQLSPFTVTGYKNRVYTWTTSGSITF